MKKLGPLLTGIVVLMFLFSFTTAHGQGSDLQGQIIFVNGNEPAIWPLDTTTTYRVRAKVTNMGMVNAPSCIATFKYGGEQFPPAFTIPELAVGMSYEFERVDEANPFDARCEYWGIVLTIDTTNLVDEFNEGNNRVAIVKQVACTTTTPTPTPSPTMTPTPTLTPTSSPTASPTATTSPSPTATTVTTGTSSPSPTASATPSPTATSSPTASPTPSATPSLTPSPTPTPIPSPTALPNCITFEAENCRMIDSASAGSTYAVLPATIGGIETPYQELSSGNKKITVRYRNQENGSRAVKFGNTNEYSQLYFPNSGNAWAEANIILPINRHGYNYTFEIVWNQQQSTGSLDVDRIEICNFTGPLPSPTPTFTATPTLTPVPTATPSSTASPSPTAVFTASPTVTATISPTATAISLPDLWVEILANPNDVEWVPGRTYELRLRVRNLGSANANAALAHLQVGGETDPHIINVGPITAGSTWTSPPINATAPLNPSPAACFGNWGHNATIDPTSPGNPQGSVIESNENNNQAAALVKAVQCMQQTVTPTASPSQTPTNTPNPTASPSPTNSMTPSMTISPSVTPSATATISPTAITPTGTSTVTPTATAGPTPSPSRTATPSPTASPSPSITISPSTTPSATATVSPSATPTSSVAPTPVINCTDRMQAETARLVGLSPSGDYVRFPAMEGKLIEFGPMNLSAGDYRVTIGYHNPNTTNATRSGKFSGTSPYTLFTFPAGTDQTSTIITVPNDFGGYTFVLTFNTSTSQGEVWIDWLEVCRYNPTPSATPTASPTPSASVTPSRTPTMTATPSPSVTISPTGFPTATVTISPTASPSATPSPTSTYDMSEVCYQFAQGVENWKPGSPPGPEFRAPRLTWLKDKEDSNDGSLTAETADLFVKNVKNTHQFINFGWWDNVVPGTARASNVPEDVLYVAQWDINSNAQQQKNNPSWRGRIITPGWSMVGETHFAPTSTAMLSPTAAPRRYTQVMDPGSIKGYYLGWDFLDIISQLQPKPRVMLRLDDVCVKPILISSLGSEMHHADWDLRGTQNGFIFKHNGAEIDPIIPLLPPSAEVHPEGLALFGKGNNHDSTNTYYGSWERWSDDNLRIVANRMYRVDFEVVSTATAAQKATVPSFRLRVNSGDFQLNAATYVTSIDGNSQVPTSTNAETYSVWFQAPQEIAGSRLVICFDYLSAAGNTDSPTLAVILREVHIRSYDGITVP